MSETVIYKPYDGSDGLQVINGKLIAWRDGNEAGSAPVSADEDLPRLLLDFRVPELLPELEFTMGPEALTIDLELDIRFEVEGMIIGSLTYDGERVPWEARCQKGEEFLRRDLPAEARPWAANDNPGEGWSISLPGDFCRSPDTVLCQRVALAIEAFLYRLAGGDEVPLPYLVRVSNVFSADRPTWAAPLPRVELLGA